MTSLKVFFLSAAMAFAVFCSGTAMAAGKTDFELGVAGGASLNGIKTTQFMVLGAWSRTLYPDLLLRAEPTFEVLSSDENTLYVGGASLVLRALAPYKTVTPFVDMGAGLNATSSSHFDNRRLGGDFLFDLVLGGGVIVKDFSISYRYRHLSNAGIFKLNEGADSFYILLGYRL
ncbi:MAG: acyloxyacyl hydrolase [Nitrospiraceae bacterium]|nr:acyloxyacyl hydrolase [Nitrospiraceae bacterium]